MQRGKSLAGLLMLFAFEFFPSYRVTADLGLNDSSQETTVSLELRRIKGNFQNILEEMRKGNYHNALLQAQEIAEQNLNRDTNLYWVSRFYIVDMQMQSKNYSRAIPIIEEVLDKKKQILS